MLTWKVWADQELLIEGDEGVARQFLVACLPHDPEPVLESPDGDSYRYQDGMWMVLDTADFSGSNWCI